MEYIRNTNYGNYTALSAFKDIIKFASWIVYFNVDDTMLNKMQQYASYNFFDNNLFKEQLFDYFSDLEHIYCPICNLNIINNESNLYRHMHITKKTL